MSGTTAASGRTIVPAVAVSPSVVKQSYWLVSSTGQVFARDGAKYYGQLPRTKHAIVTGIVSTHDGRGYWLLSRKDRWAFGDARGTNFKSVKLLRFSGHVKLAHLRGRIVGVAYPPAVVKKTTTSTQTSGSAPQLATAVPDPIYGAPYSQSVLTNQNSSDKFSVAAGHLPTGLALSARGILSGLPYVGGSFTFRITAKNVHGTATRSYTVVVDYTDYSMNWSGYADEGHSYTRVSGTFTVPTLSVQQPTTGNSMLSEWVGIDGVTNSDLIQAGVFEEPGFGPEAWWEILPAYATFIPNLKVNVGDTVTVTINKLATAGYWNIDIVDVTTSQSYPITEPYSGPATSAEWILEAPTLNNVQTVPAAFTGTTTFRNISSAGTLANQFALTLQQNSVSYFEPSQMENNSFSLTDTANQ